MVSHNLRPNENFRTPWNLIQSPPCRTPYRLFIHEVFFGPLGLHIRVWSELGRSPPFRPMRARKLQWSRAFSLVCEVALSCRWIGRRACHKLRPHQTLCSIPAMKLLGIICPSLYNFFRGNIDLQITSLTKSFFIQISIIQHVYTALLPRFRMDWQLHQWMNGSVAPTTNIYKYSHALRKHIYMFLI